MTHTFTAPVAITPERYQTGAHLGANDQPGVYLYFSCGRRGAGSVDCIRCGIPIEVFGDGPDSEWRHVVPSDLPHGAVRAQQCLAAHPKVEPGREMGPVYGPFEYAQLTYQWLRVDEGEHLACWNNTVGDWVIVDDGAYAGESYSDVTISHHQHGG